MASLDGFNVFGRSVTSVLTNAPREIQETAYAGVSGTESIDLGSRGSYCIIHGTLFGAALSDYIVAESAIRAFQDGLVHTLVDTYGVTFTRARLEEFNPSEEKLVYDPLGRGYSKPYVARFRIYNT